ncbi:MAG: hypothetical protein AAFY14_12475 [Pseudomonadota bacterium]
MPGNGGVTAGGSNHIPQNVNYGPPANEARQADNNANRFQAGDTVRPPSPIRKMIDAVAHFFSNKSEGITLTVLKREVVLKDGTVMPADQHLRFVKADANPIAALFKNADSLHDPIAFTLTGLPTLKSQMSTLAKAGWQIELSHSRDHAHQAELGDKAIYIGVGMQNDRAKTVGELAGAMGAALMPQEPSGTDENSYLRYRAAKVGASILNRLIVNSELEGGKKIPIPGAGAADYQRIFEDNRDDLSFERMAQLIGDTAGFTEKVVVDKNGVSQELRLNDIFKTDYAARPRG